MTWYYMPFTSAPGTAGLSSPLETLPAPWLTLSGTPTQRPFSWPGWARRDWIKLLSGLTCAPSTLARGLAAWTSSLPVSPASRSPLPGSAPELTMTVGSGQTSAGSSVRFDPVTCSWRTCQVLFDMDYPMSSLTLPASGSMRNGVCAARPTLVPLIDANGSGLWPTARSSDGSSGSTAHSREDFRPTLKQSVAMWGAPVARDDQKSPEAHMAMKARMDRNTATSLTVQAKMWPALSAATQESTGPSNSTVPPSLTDAAAAKMWGTPRASDAARGSDPIRTNDRAGSPTLKSQATAFPHDPTTTTGGSNGMVLNPAFVAALMGLPDGWLMAEPDTSLTNCTSAATVWCRKPPDTHGSNSPHDSKGNDL